MPLPSQASWFNELTNEVNTIEPLRERVTSHTTRLDAIALNVAELMHHRDTTQNTLGILIARIQVLEARLAPVSVGGPAPAPAAPVVAPGPAPAPAAAPAAAVPTPGGASAPPAATSAFPNGGTGATSSASAVSTPPTPLSAPASPSTTAQPAATTAATPSPAPTSMPTSSAPSTTPSTAYSLPPTSASLVTVLRQYSATFGIPAAKALLIRLAGVDAVPLVPAARLAEIIAAVQRETRVGG